MGVLVGWDGGGVVGGGVRRDVTEVVLAVMEVLVGEGLRWNCWLSRC